MPKKRLNRVIISILVVLAAWLVCSGVFFFTGNPFVHENYSKSVRTYVSMKYPELPVLDLTTSYNWLQSEYDAKIRTRVRGEFYFYVFSVRSGLEDDLKSRLLANDVIVRINSYLQSKSVIPFYCSPRIEADLDLLPYNGIKYSGQEITGLELNVHVNDDSELFLTTLIHDLMNFMNGNGMPLVNDPSSTQNIGIILRTDTTYIATRERLDKNATKRAFNSETPLVYSARTK